MKTTHLRLNYFMYVPCLLLLFVVGCSEQGAEKDTPIEAEMSVQGKGEVIPQVGIKDSLTKYFYPNMSFCGGALYGFYKGDELVRIESKYSGEIGYSSKDIDFQNGKVIRIKYREHFPNYARYEKEHAGEEMNANLMVYTDTVYILEFGEKNKFRKFVEGESRRTYQEDVIRQGLIDDLLNCAEQMKQELATERVLKED